MVIEKIICPTCKKEISQGISCPECKNEVEVLKFLQVLSYKQFNNSLTFLQNKDFAKALECGYNSVITFPYNPVIFDYNLSLTLYTGYYELFLKIFSLVKELNLSSLIEKYEETSIQKISEWNEIVAEPDKLIKKANDNPKDLNFRELLILKNNYFSELNIATKELLKISGISPEFSIIHKKKNSGLIILSICLFVACITLLASKYIIEDNSSKKIEFVEQPFIKIFNLYGSNDNLGALNLLENEISPRNQDSSLLKLRKMILGNLITEGKRAFLEKEYFLSEKKLEAILKYISEDPNAYYYLGLAAFKNGNPATSERAFKRLLELKNVPQHYVAQAAYLLAINCSHDEAVNYARIIYNDYKSTIYYNSKIKSILNGH